MDKKVIKFLKTDPDLKQAISDGKDVYATFASKLFNCDYEDCLEYKDNQPYLPGLYRRKVAKTMLCAMYFSTKRKWRSTAFEMINKFQFIGENKDVLTWRN